MAASSTSPPPPPSDNSVCCPALNLTLAFLLLRLFMGMRLVLSGLEKMGYLVGKGTTTFKETLTLKALGDALSQKAWFGEGGLAANEGFGDGRMWNVGKAMLDNSLLPEWMIKPFLICLPYAMLLSGLMILLGLLNRAAWWLAGLIWFSLAFGQMLLPDEQTIQWLGLYVFVCALALSIVEHNRIRITKF
jgi:hypothetical protein